MSNVGINSPGNPATVSAEIRERCPKGYVFLVQYAEDITLEEAKRRATFFHHRGPFEFVRGYFVHPRLANCFHPQGWHEEEGWVVYRRVTP